MAREGTAWAHDHIDAFAGRSLGEPIWPHLRRPKVAAGLHVRVDDPEQIDQFDTSLCGITGFVRDWAYDAPNIYAWVATNLYETGHAVLGRGWHANKIIQPSSDLRNARLPARGPDRLTQTTEMNHADWLVLASLREAFNTLFHYSGTQRGVVGSIFDPLLKLFGASTELIEAGNTSGDVVAAFKAAGYEKPIDRTKYFTSPGFDNAMEASALLAGGYRVVLLINARMLDTRTENTQAMLIPASDHWVNLATRIEVDVARGVRFKVHSWGRIMYVPIISDPAAPKSDPNAYLPAQAFLKNYYGFVAAKF